MATRLIHGVVLFIVLTLRVLLIVLQPEWATNNLLLFVVIEIVVNNMQMEGYAPFTLNVIESFINLDYIPLFLQSIAWGIIIWFFGQFKYNAVVAILFGFIVPLWPANIWTSSVIQNNIKIY